MRSLIIVTLVGLACACSERTADTPPPDDPLERLHLAFVDAAPGDVIEIPAGHYALRRPLVLNANGVTVRGAGMEATVLDFSGQLAGAEAMLVTGNDFTIEDLAIENAPGDALKINEGRNIVIRRVRTEWTGGPATDNGAYGIYPVQTENVLIEGAVAIGASDAGIYVGQSRNVVVRNSRAEFNVAGIEIENSVDADVHDNVARHNTGGILVFNMPNLAVEGRRTRIFRNRIEDNDTDNFAAPGSAVSGVPAGTGVAVNSNDDVEIFDNDFSGHRTAHIVISSVFSTNYSEREAADSFDPYPERIAIHDNRYRGGGERPDTDYLPALKDAAFGPDGAFPHVIWDGFVNPRLASDGILPPQHAICIYNEPSSAVFNVDAANDFAAPRLEEAEHDCRHAPLPSVELPIAG